MRLKEKGGKRHKVPSHHNLEAYLTAYIDSAGISNDPKGPLFRTIGPEDQATHPDPSAASQRLRHAPAPCRGCWYCH